MFRRILVVAFAAGVPAAMVLTLVQALWVTPLILQAEAYEAQVTPHESGHTAWQPEEGWPRTLATAAANAGLGGGYGLMLSGLLALRRPTGKVHGLAWGLAGFGVFFVAPALGLPPELPGTEAAELSARQHWWLGTVAATAAGLALLLGAGVTGHRRPGRAGSIRAAMAVVGLSLLAAPHVVGAPQPAVAASLAPEELQSRFRLATLASNGLFWLLLGVLGARMFDRYGAGGE